MLRSLKQATYTPEPEGHYALASQDYCHFTSPIRRYPDLQVHRQLIALLEGKKPRAKHDELVVLGQHCTRTERRAEAAERELIRVKLLSYLEDHVGKAFHAIIVGVEDFGLFCRLSELPVEGLIHVTSLADDYYYLEAGTHTLVGRRSGRRHRLGDREIVRIAHVDVDRRELDLVLADSPVSRARPARKGRFATTTAGRAIRPGPTGQQPGRSDTNAAADTGSGPRRRKGPKKKKRPRSQKGGKEETALERTVRVGLLNRAPAQSIARSAGPGLYDRQSQLSG